MDIFQDRQKKTNYPISKNNIALSFAFKLAVYINGAGFSKFLTQIDNKLRRRVGCSNPALAFDELSINTIRGHLNLILTQMVVQTAFLLFFDKLRNTEIYSAV